jgi:hypothetical protein
VGLLSQLIGQLIHFLSFQWLAFGHFIILPEAEKVANVIEPYDRMG